MRIFLTILACLGLVLVLIAALPALFATFLNLISEPTDFGKVLNQIVIMGYYPGALGVLLVLIGGLITRPRYLWIVLITIGLIHAISFLEVHVYIFWPPSHPIGMSMLRFLLLTSPGIICIIEGIIIRMIEKKKGEAAPLESMYGRDDKDSSPLGSGS
jgi:hypothetical protein